MLVLFFFKQKTAYEMRISDWSSDVCSSDLSWVHSEMPCLSPSPSRGRPGWGWVLPGLEGNPSPPNPPLDGEGFNMCHGFFAISEITSKFGGRFLRVTVSDVCTARPALQANLGRPYPLTRSVWWRLPPPTH